MSNAYKSHIIASLFFGVMGILATLIGVDIIIAFGMSWLASILVFFFFYYFYYDEEVLTDEHNV